MTHRDTLGSLPQHPTLAKGRWDDRQRLIDRKEAAALGLSSRFLEIAAVTGDGPPFIKLGRAVRYRVGDLLDWIDSHRFRSTSEASVSVNKSKGNGRG